MRLVPTKSGPPVEESLTLRSSAEAPGAARRFVRRLVRIEEQRDVVELLVSELVTNAVCYVRGDVQLTLGTAGDRIRVEVSDTSPLLPRMREPSLAGGRGLRFVEALADRWGVDRRGDGKTVWFEISAAAAAGGVGPLG